jgi:twinkle protein
MDKFDIKGASELSDMPDNVFSLWRNKAKEAKAEAGKLDEEGKAAPDAVLMCDKQRHGDWEGRVTLWFNRKTLQYVGRNTTQPIDYLKKGGVDDLFGEEGGHDS